jgi:hypothetical protein
VCIRKVKRRDEEEKREEKRREEKRREEKRREEKRREEKRREEKRKLIMLPPRSNTNSQYEKCINKSFKNGENFKCFGTTVTNISLTKKSRID